MLRAEDWPTDEDCGIPPRAAPKQTLIHCDEIGPGWPYIYADNPPSDPTRLPYLLNDAFGRWRKQNPKSPSAALCRSWRAGRRWRFTSGLIEVGMREAGSGNGSRRGTVFLTAGSPDQSLFRDLQDVASCHRQDTHMATLGLAVGPEASRACSGEAISTSGITE